MANYELSFYDYFRIFRKRWIIILVIVLASVLFCLFYWKSQEPIYESSTTIQVIQRNTLAGILSEALLRQGNTLQTSVDLIRSAAVLRKVARECGYIDDQTPPEQVNQAIERLKGEISVGRKGQTELITITVRGPDQYQVVRVAESVAENYRRFDTEREKAEAQTVRVFVQDQLQNAQEQLTVAEAEMVALQREAYGTGIDESTELTVKSLSGLETEYLTAKQQRQEREITLDKMQELLRRGEYYTLLSSFTEGMDPGVVDLKRKLVAQESQLADLLKEYTEHHPAVIDLKEQVTATQARLREEVARQIKQRQESLATEIDLLRTKERIVGEKMNQLNGKLSVLPERQQRIAAVQRRVGTYSEIVGMLTRELEAKRIAEAGRISGATVVQPATPNPGRMIYPQGRTTILTGALIGLLLGIAFAFIIESLDTSIATIEDVEKYTGKPVIGVIPHIELEGDQVKKRRLGFKVRKEKTSLRDLQQKLGDLEHEVTGAEGEHRLDARLITFYDPKSPISEAYRTLRTNIFYLDQAKHSKIFVITSSGPQEGKTTTIANLGITMAQMGAKTLLLECNLRRPQLYKMLGVAKANGIVDIIKGNLAWPDAVKATGIENLSIITCGGIPPNPSELLAAKEMTNLLRDVRPQYDYVLIDSPPLLPVTDAAILGSKADCTVLVYFIGKAAREALLRAKVMLENVRANVLGIVLNDLASKAELGKGSYYYYYYHYRYYGNEKRETKSPAGGKK